MRVRLTFVRACIRFSLIVGLALAGVDQLRAGGVNFGDDNGSTVDEGPSFFGFVRDAGGSAVAGAKVTASIKTGGALVTRSNVMGVYKIPGFGKDVDPDSIVISCDKDGYKEANVLRRPRTGDAKDPIEVECYLQKE
jgi:hypothetical protein